MAVRLLLGCLVGLVVVLGFGVSQASGVDVLVTANANLSTLVTADDTVLHWTGSYTVTVDAAYTGKTVSGIDAGSFTATIDFQNADRKIILGNSTGNVVVQANGGELRVAGAGTGARTAGFLVSPSLTSETVEIRAAVDDAVNANYWIIGKHRLLMAGTSPQAGAVDIGQDGEVATLDVDVSGTVDLITPTGDFTLDVASGKSLAITQALSIGANTMTVIGASSTSAITNVAQITLDQTSSVLQASGTVSVSDVTIGASATISLLDGALLILPDAVSIGAQTLTLKGTTGSAPDRITATTGFKLDNVNSVLKVMGDTADAMVVSKVDTGAELNVGKGIDADESVEITALSVLHAVTLDVAPGKTLSGTATMTVARTITLNNTGTVSAITTSTAAGTVNFTGAGTVTTLTNSVAGTTLDVDESATVTTMVLSENTTVDVTGVKALTATATVAAGKTLTLNGTGTISRVVLNGLNAEVNVTGGGTLTTLDVNADGGVLDVDAINCTVTKCNMTANAGNLTVEHGSRRITTTSGFDVNNNTLTISQATGTIDLVTMDTFGGVLDVNESTTITALSVTASVEVKAAASRVLTTTATIGSSGILSCSETGTLSAVALNAAGAELNMTAGGQVTTVSVSSDGGLLDIDANSTLTTVSMDVGKGDLTLDMKAGVTLTSAIDVNDNRLTLSGTGVPGTITLDTDGGILDVDADVSPTYGAITGDVTIDVAASKTLAGTFNMGATTLTLSGSGTVSRIDATVGTIIANGTTTIADLRTTFGSGGTFTYGGSGKSSITTMSNSTIGSGERFAKTGSGTLTVEAGLETLFSKATGVAVSIEQGELVFGTSGSNHDITFNDDGDEITVASGATLTTYGTFLVTGAGTNINVDAADGSVINLQSAGGTETITAAADNDYRLLGTVSVSGAGATYTLVGSHVFQFGDIEIAGTASLINEVPSSTIKFAPGSTVTLSGTGSSGGALTVDGQSTGTRIVMTTTESGAAFTIDRGVSGNLTIDNVALSNATYRSEANGAAKDELDLTGTADVDGNTNWFSATFVADDAVSDDDVAISDGGADGADDTGAQDDQAVDETRTYTGQVANVGRDGTASAGAASTDTDAAGFVDIKEAVSGSVFVVIADGNLRSDFEGIPAGETVPVTMRASSSVTGDFRVVVQLCLTDALLDVSGLELSELVLYTYSEPDGPWVLAGESGRYRGDLAPTDIVGDYGYDSEFMCIWAVRDSLSDFAVGTGPTDSSGLEDETATDGASDDTSVDDVDAGPATPPLCGLLGMITASLMAFGFAGLRLLSRRWK